MENNSYTMPDLKLGEILDIFTLQIAASSSTADNKPL